MRTIAHIFVAFSEKLNFNWTSIIDWIMFFLNEKVLFEKMKYIKISSTQS